MVIRLIVRYILLSLRPQAAQFRYSVSRLKVNPSVSAVIANVGFLTIISGLSVQYT